MKKSVALALVAAGVGLQSPLGASRAQRAADVARSRSCATRRFRSTRSTPKKIKEYTTEPFFSSPLVDYLPASKTVPTPKAVLGDVAGAPGKLPYAEEVYQYMRMLEKAAPRA